RSGVSAKSNRASMEVPDKYVIGNGDFIFSWSGSLLAKFWTDGPGALNQHLFKVTSESHPMWFVGEWVQTHLEEFQRIAAAKAVTMGHIKRSHLSEAMCVCPKTDSIEKLGEFIEPLILKQIANEEENQNLAKMRDLLLPKLMSGEISLRNAQATP
ncbi:MAG: restriction endonuclease subunit S, partial [Rhodospirillales bacterium]|nr:restriction endonuclease subunit S [Rhodospirillales bacterium]